MNILYVITGLGGGGAEKVVCDLADHMHALGHSVKIVYLKGKDVVVRPQCNKIDLIYLGFESALNVFIASSRYKKIIHDFQPNIIAHMVHANIFCRINRIFSKIPKLICTAHNANEGGCIRMFCYQLTNNLSDLNTNVSVEALESFKHKNAFDDNAIAIYNGIDINKFKFISKDNRKIKNILAVGRLNVQKDYPNLLKALSLIQDKSFFKLSIAGEGEERQRIEQLIKEYELESCVELLGRRNDIPELFQQADLFVLSSAYEGFGLVVAEAMASNTIVVATDCGGVKEVMGGTGILVQPKNSIALSDGILKALKLSEVEILENNLKARQHIISNFDLNTIIEKWLEIYEK